MKDPTPPQWVARWMDRLCDPQLVEGINGDLNEIFIENARHHGVLRARWSYVLHSLGFIRSRFLRKKNKRSDMRSLWFNHLQASFRSIKKHKLVFGANLIGLVLAIACSLFAIIFIKDEFQFDRKYSEHEDIYRLYKRYINESEGIDMLTAETSGLMGPTMMDEFPEVLSSLRINPWYDKEAATTSSGETFTLHNLYWVDSTFFDFFNFRLLQGNPKTALTKPGSMVLSQGTAKSMFGSKNPIGEVIVSLNDIEFQVTGIVEDAPRQSHLSYDALASWSTTVPDHGPLNFSFMNNWLAQTMFTYVKLSPNANPDPVVAKLPEMMRRHFEERADQYFLKLQPLREVYLRSDAFSGIRSQKQGSIRFIYILAFSAALILIIASINYINITLSRSSESLMEVGVRKVMGSSRTQLIGRFIAETFISVVLASMLAMVLLYAFWPAINNLTEKVIPPELLLHPSSVTFLAGFMLVLSVIVGFYPAYIQSSTSTASILLRHQSHIGSTGWFRRILLILQYGVSGALIICTLIVSQQTDFLLNKPLGFDKDRVLVIDIDNEVGSKPEVLEAELLKHSNIRSVSISRAGIGRGNFGTTVIPEGEIDPINVRLFGVDQEFFQTYSIGLTRGRFFAKGSNADQNQVIINQAFSDLLNWSEPVGKIVRFGPSDPGSQIIGVVDDFHYSSPNTNTIEPMVLYLELRPQYIRTASIKIGDEDMHQTISHIAGVWKMLATRTPFDFYFVDDWFDSHLSNERTLLRTASLYSVISLLLCGLGLYGITSLTLQQRTREISIRKVLGASTKSVVSMVSRQFMLLIVVGLGLGTPIAYLLASNWLEQFSYKIELTGSAFIITSLVITLASVGIISALAGRASNVNPAKTLNQG